MDMKSNLIVVRNCEQDFLRHFLMEGFPYDSGGLPIDEAARFNHIEVVWILIEEGRGSTIRIRTTSLSIRFSISMSTKGRR